MIDNLNLYKFLYMGIIDSEVIVLERRYSDLNALIQANHSAWRYFILLPNSVREQMMLEPYKVHTFAELRSYAAVRPIEGDRQMCEG